MLEKGIDKGNLGDMQRGINSQTYSDSDLNTKLEPSDKHYKVEDDWNNDPEPKEPEVLHGDEKISQVKKTKKNSLVKKLFLLSLLFLIGSVLFATFIILKDRTTPTADNIKLELLGPVSVAGGDTINLQVFIANKNTSKMEDVKLLTEYSEGIVFAQSDEPAVRGLVNVGDIEPTGVVNETIPLIFFGEENASKTIHVILEYRFEGMNKKTVLTKEAVYEVELSSSPIKIDFDVLSEAVEGQEIDLVVSIQSETDEIIDDVIVDLSYPYGFVFSAANPTPTYSDRVWSIGDLLPFEKKTIRIRGSVISEESSEMVFNVDVGTESTQNKRVVGVLYGTRVETLHIKKPFVGFDLQISAGEIMGMTSVSDDFSFISAEDSAIRGVLTWVNNLPSRIVDLEVYLEVEGSAVVMDTFFSKNGLFDLNSNTASWVQRSEPKMAILEPGESSSVSFKMDTVSALKENGTLYISPEVKFRLRAYGKRSDNLNVPEEVTIENLGSIRIKPTVNFLSIGRYYGGPIANTGPVPLKVGETTTFTIAWQVTNTTSDITDVVVTSKLPRNVEFNGMMIPKSEVVEYNKKTGDLTWFAGEVKTGSGYVAQSRELIFQLELTPNIVNVDDSISIIGETDFIATSVFTDYNYQITEQSISIKDIFPNNNDSEVVR